MRRSTDPLSVNVVVVYERDDVNASSWTGSVVSDSDPSADEYLFLRQPLGPLALHARRLQGHAQSFNRGADVFLADRKGTYIGRTCRWKTVGLASGKRAMRVIAGDAPISTTILIR